MNAGRSDVSFFVYCLRVVDVFNDDNFFAQTEVTMFITRSVCFALFLNFPLYNWLRYYFIAFIQFIIPYEVRECRGYSAFVQVCKCHIVVEWSILLRAI